MSQQGPSPIEVYELAVQVLAPIMAGVTAAQLGSTTPCTEWSVQSLINHSLAVQNFANTVLSKGTVDPSAMGNVDHDLPSEGAGAAFKLITDTTLATLKAVNLEEIVETPLGAMPAGNFIMIPITDMIIHKWDLANATGQHSAIDDALAEIGIQVLTPGIAQGREGGFFGPEVSVMAGASAQDRLLGLSGGTP
ncbi:MAG: TIGR03086 family protein [Chloroflexi bacterium]|nr:TIGR03086 family protein [Chloroflexota bacterium]